MDKQEYLERSRLMMVDILITFLLGVVVSMVLLFLTQHIGRKAILIAILGYAPAYILTIRLAIFMRVHNR